MKTLKEIKYESKTIANVPSVDLQKQIDKNRNEIDKWLNGDYLLELIYKRIKMLSNENERLMIKLKSV